MNARIHSVDLFCPLPRCLSLLGLSLLVTLGGCVDAIGENDVNEEASEFDYGDAIVYAWHEGSDVRASLFLAGDTESDGEAFLRWQEDGQLLFEFSGGESGHAEIVAGDDESSTVELPVAAQLLYEAWRSPQESPTDPQAAVATASQATGIIKWRNRRVSQCAQLALNNNVVLRNCSNAARQRWREHRVRVQVSPTRAITLFRFENVASSGLCLTRGPRNVSAQACPALPGPGQNFNMAHRGYFFRIPHAGGWLITRATRYVSSSSFAPNSNVLVRTHPNPASSLGVDHWDRLVVPPQNACPSPDPRMRLQPEFSVGMEEQFALQRGEVLTIPFNSGAVGRTRRLAFGEPGPGFGEHFSKTVILSRCPGVYNPQSYDHTSSVNTCPVTGLEMAFSIVTGQRRADYPLSHYRCVLEPHQKFYINVFQRYAGSRPPYTADMTNTCRPSASGLCGVRVSAR